MSDSIHLCIVQGKTFQKTIYAETKPLKYVPVSGVASVSPVSVDVINHGVPDGWRVTFTGVRGMTQLNAENWLPLGADWHRATVVNSNRVQLNEVDGSKFDAYVSGGSLVYWTPESLTGCTARMEIRQRVGGTLYETLTTENGKIVIDAGAYTTSLLIPAEDTAAYTWRRGVFDLELVKGDGTVLSLMHGDVSLTREVTTDD